MYKVTVFLASGDTQVFENARDWSCREGTVMVFTPPSDPAAWTSNATVFAPGQWKTLKALWVPEK